MLGLTSSIVQPNKRLLCYQLMKNAHVNFMSCRISDGIIKRIFTRFNHAS
uniref:Uncharacterized protein n=1 Tax=Rhizophora mucronata TaxID=61149 RepID=A0A2P2PC66_RHIMU